LIIFKKSKNITQKKYWDFAVRVSFPIILHGLSLNILSQSDRIMLTSLIGASETGVYSLIYNFGMISYVVVVSLDGVWVPWFYKNLAKKDFRIINKNAKVYIDIMAVVTSIIILMSIEIMRFIAPPQYWYGEIIIPPIVISSFIIFVYTLYVNVEHYYKETRLIAFNTIVAAISNIMMNLFFIPSFGILGAATSTLISYILSLIMHYKNSRKIESNLFPIGVIFKPMVLILVTVLVYYSFREYTVIRWTIALVIIVMLCRKYKDIIISKFKAK
jgi:O-antigen/teichoic acid export membrane protein